MRNIRGNCSLETCSNRLIDSSVACSEGYCCSVKCCKELLDVKISWLQKEQVGLNKLYAKRLFSETEVKDD